MDPGILIVEGEGVLSRALSSIKNSLDLTLHVAADALHAISLLQLHSYTVLVIDEKVGYVDGWALLRYLEENSLSLDTIIVPSAGASTDFDLDFAVARRVPIGDLAEAVSSRIRQTRKDPNLQRQP